MNRKKWLVLGVVLSVIWAISAGVKERNDDIEAAQAFGNLSYRACMSNPGRSGPAGAATCEEERKNSIATWMKDSNSGSNVAFIALAPIPLGWLAGYILLMLWRIQVAGFHTVFPWRSLSALRKLAVCACGVVIAAVCLLFSIVVMNLYTDARVPVGLSPFLDVDDYGGETVTATGTWTRHGFLPGSEMGYPLQSSKIVCSHSERRCTEARATVSEAGQSGKSSMLLPPDVTDYEVTSWDHGVVTYNVDDLCTSESFSIDVNTKSASGIGRATNDDNTWCKANPLREREWSYRLESGYNVYSALRQKNRPVALRIIQSFFGN